MLGMMHYNGRGVWWRSIGTATHLFEGAAMQGHAGSQYQLAMINRIDEKDYIEAFAWMKAYEAREGESCTEFSGGLKKFETRPGLFCAIDFITRKMTDEQLARGKELAEDYIAMYVEKPNKRR